MNDYKELIKRLRVAVDVHEVKGCVLEISAETCAEIAYAIEQLTKERDTAIHDLEMAVCGQESYPCRYCANYGINPIDVEDVCEHCTDCEKWEWRGVQNEEIEAYH